jgi:hypothetical protein
LVLILILSRSLLALLASTPASLPLSGVPRPLRCGCAAAATGLSLILILIPAS